MKSTKTSQNGRVFSYARWSSDAQESGDSRRRQTTLAEQWCQRHGCELDDDRFIDAGVSARQGKNRHGDLGRLINELKPGDRVLVEDADRLTRQGWQNRWPGSMIRATKAPERFEIQQLFSIEYTL